MVVIGIDPGKSGGIAWASLDGSKRGAYSVTGKSEREISDILQDLSFDCCMCYLERIHAMPKDKKWIVSFSKIMLSYGVYRGMLNAHRIPFQVVTPRVWQSSLKCLTKGDKKISRAKAQQLFPNLKITHATADALLIAEFGRRLENVRNGKVNKPSVS